MWKSESQVQLFATLPRLLRPWNSPGKNIGVGNHPFFGGSSWHRDETQVSCIAGRFFTIWATREAHAETYHSGQICKWDILFGRD